MADFRTHVVGATAPSVVFATWLASEQTLSLPVCAACVACGAAGGLLPDVDSESSISARLVFTIVAVFSALVGASVAYHHFTDSDPFIAPLIAMLLVYVLVRYALCGLFHAVTVHRGVFHSLPMAAACGLAVFHALSRLLPGMDGAAMSMALFLAGGFVVHLLLDELYSVDLAGLRFKRSFGTALKLGSRSNRLGTLTLYLAVAAMVFPLLDLP